MKHYSKPYPTIGDLIKNTNYDYVSYRVTWKDTDVFAGCFKAEDDRIIPLDDDTYEPEEEVLASEEWSRPEVDVYHGLTVVVEGVWSGE